MIESIKNFFNSLNNFQIFIIVLLLSIIYAAFINPHSQETVTFAYISNKIDQIDYFENWINISKNQEPSLQILIPIILFKLGLDKYSIHIIWQTLTVTVSFASFFLFSKLITNSNFYSLLIILILINHKFINTRLYGIYYPSGFYFLGQMGMYLTLLSYSLFLNYRTSSSFIILIINIFSHAGWGALNLILLVITKILNFKEYQISFKQILITFGIFVFSTILFVQEAKKNELFSDFFNSAEKVFEVNEEKNKSYQKKK